ncbi:MAG: hypothetical protein ACW99G_02545 [Candidatus Thorarchaeota archaeon]
MTELVHELDTAIYFEQVLPVPFDTNIGLENPKDLEELMTHVKEFKEIRIYIENAGYKILDYSGGSFVYKE